MRRATIAVLHLMNVAFGQKEGENQTDEEHKGFEWNLDVAIVAVVVVSVLIATFAILFYICNRLHKEQQASHELWKQRLKRQVTIELERTKSLRKVQPVIDTESNMVSVEVIKEEKEQDEAEDD